MEKYIVLKDQRMVVCEMTDKFGKKFRGVAKCDTKDTFNEETGKRIAFLRATNKRKRAYINGYLRQTLSAYNYAIDNLVKEKTAVEHSINDLLKIIAKNCEEISNI